MRLVSARLGMPRGWRDLAGEAPADVLGVRGDPRVQHAHDSRDRQPAAVSGTTPWPTSLLTATTWRPVPRQASASWSTSSSTAFSAVVAQERASQARFRPSRGSAASGGRGGPASRAAGARSRVCNGVDQWPASRSRWRRTGCSSSCEVRGPRGTPSRRRRPPAPWRASLGLARLPDRAPPSVRPCGSARPRVVPSSTTRAPSARASSGCGGLRCERWTPTTRLLQRAEPRAAATASRQASAAVGFGSCSASEPGAPRRGGRRAGR